MSVIQPYKGNDSYIFISYSHRDSALVFPVIERMLGDGYRVWYDEGIDPGSEWDENIARHVAGCEYFIAFVSQNYLSSANCKDELNFARDRDKHILLIYLEKVNLSAGMEMRLNRLQYISKYGYQREESFYEKLYSAEDIHLMQGAVKEVRQETASKKEVTASSTGAKRAEVTAIHPYSGEWFRLFGLSFFMKVFGVLAAVVFAILLFAYNMEETVGIVFSIGVPLSLLLLWMGGKHGRRQREVRYLALINEQGSFSLNILAGAVGRTVEKTCRDLRRMIYEGKLGNAYVDRARGVLETKTPDPAVQPIYIPKSSAPIVTGAIAILGGLVAIVAFGLMEIGGEEFAIIAFADAIVCVLFSLISLGLRASAKSRLILLILIKAYRIYSVRELEKLSGKSTYDIYRIIEYFSSHHYLHAEVDYGKSEIVLKEE